MAALNLRSNALHSEIVDRALALQQRAGTVCALEYLKSHSVTPHVIQRVLLYPQQTRRVSNREVMHKN
ncbi:hypothetical protein IP92_01184 [Pseudoduganella flava]|uniref:Uncharacterized protein n=1 Tax=Pseudoduganella flava TaxID=871742 RepID=A0A562Q0J3_9BURK|nr:hypothetical protein [Pseudoduganella flava]QGZ38486.1 hypothetical protein GO485_05075 [Pseudoduganella flava]TWI49960.1 hypothetical protein IP92_01184 [Pseudoduganella flava]